MRALAGKAARLGYFGQESTEDSTTQRDLAVDLLTGPPPASSVHADRF